MVITGNGKREWCYYARDYDKFMAMLNAALQGQERFPIQVEHSADAEWSYWDKIKALTETNQKSAEKLDFPSAEVMKQTAREERPAAQLAQSAAYEAAGKKIAAIAFKLMNLPPIEYVECKASTFSDLDLAFYERTTQELKACGLDRIVDVEPLHNTRMSGKRILTRFMSSSAEPLYVAVYSHFPPAPGFFGRLFNWLLGRKTRHQIGTIEFENGFSNGEYVCTNTSLGKNHFSAPAQIHTLQMPPGTPAKDVLDEHRRRVDEFMRLNPGVTRIKTDSLAELAAQDERQQNLKMAYRRSIGGITREELLGLTKEKFPYVEEHVMKEMQRLIAEKDKADAQSAKWGRADARSN